MTSFVQGLIPPLFRQEQKPKDEQKKEEDERRQTQLAGENVLYGRWRERLEEAEPAAKLIHDEIGYTFLHYAALDGEVHVVRGLLGAGMDPNIEARAPTMVTPLHWACVRGHIEVVLLLIQAGGLVRKADAQGYDALITAAQYGQTGLVHMLLHKGLSVNTRDLEGHTVLHWAAYMNRPTTAELLLNHGASIDAPDKQGLRPLHRAVKRGNGEMAKMLVRAGCSVDIVSDKDVRQLAKTDTLKHWLTGAANNSLRHRLVMRYGSWGALLWIRVVFFLHCAWGYYIYFTQFWPHHNIYPYLHDLALVSSIFALIFYFRANQRDPGFITGNETEKKHVEEMCCAGDVDSICHSCELRRPLRSKHCTECRRCVAKMDHHCAWLGNCVGANNHIDFLLFLLFALIVCVLFNFAMAYRLTLQPDAPALWNVVRLWMFGLWEFPIFTGSWLWLSFISVYFLLVLYSQVNAVLTNTTSNEILNAWRYKYLQRDSEYYNPFDQGPWRNLLAFFSPALEWIGINHFSTDYFRLFSYADLSASPFLRGRLEEAVLQVV